MGEKGWTGRLLVAPIPIMAELVWDRLPQPAAYLLVMEQGPQVKARGMPKGPKMVREALQTKRTPVHFSVSDDKLGATWLGSVPPQPSHYNKLGELREYRPTLHQQQPTVNLQNPLPAPKPKLTILKAAQKRG